MSDDTPGRPAGGAARQATGRGWIVWALVLALAAALRVYAIGREPLWLDEGYSWWDARQSLTDLWRLVPLCDPQPPLYPTLLKFWMALAGESAIALRLFSALAGVAATGVVMLAGRELGRRTAWLAGLLFAIAPFQIEFAHEARQYTLLALGGALVAFGGLRLLRTVREPLGHLERQAGWLALVAGTVVTLWTHNTSVLTAAALGLAFALLLTFDRGARTLARPLAIAVALTALLWLPYLPMYIEQVRGVTSDFWIPPPDAGRVVNELRLLVGLGSRATLPLLLMVWACGLALLWRRGMRREAWLLGALAVLPVALNLAVSLTVKPVFIARVLISVAPAFVICVAAALAALDGRALRISAVTALAAARIMASVALVGEEHRKEPWDQIAHQIVLEAGGDALVLMVPNELGLPLGHALGTAQASLTLRGVPQDFPAPGIKARYPSGKCAPSVVDQDLTQMVHALRGHRTVLFVTRRNNWYDPKDQIAALLRAEGLVETLQKEFRPGSLMVRKFVARRGAPSSIRFLGDAAKRTGG
jgi:hypothetical protein